MYIVNVYTMYIVHVRIYPHTYMYMYVYTCTCIYIHVYMYLPTHIYTYIHVCALYISTHLHLQRYGMDFEALKKMCLGCPQGLWEVMQRCCQVSGPSCLSCSAGRAHKQIHTHMQHMYILHTHATHVHFTYTCNTCTFHIHMQHMYIPHTHATHVHSTSIQFLCIALVSVQNTRHCNSITSAEINLCRYMYT